MSKILIIYTSVGLGHKVIAENIAQALRNSGEGLKEGLEVKMLDILEFYGGGVTSSGWMQKLYIAMLAHTPALWRFFYTNKIFNWLTLPLRIPVAALRARKLERFIAAARPDLILTTETMPTAMVSYLKLRKKYRGPLVTTFSDYHFQPYWVYPRVDRYLAIIPEQIDEILKRGYGLKREQIVLTGMPLDEAFEREYDRTEVLKKYNLPTNRAIVAVMGGSRGWGVGQREIAALLALPGNFEIVFFTGTSEELYREFAPLAARNKRLHIFRWLPNREIAAIFSVARVLITKAGGLTTAGAIALRLPMVLINPLHIGEELNEAYLTSRGVGVQAQTIEELAAEVFRLLHDEEHYQAARRRLQHLAIPRAAAKAAAAIVDIL